MNWACSQTKPQLEYLWRLLRLFCRLSPGSLVGSMTFAMLTGTAPLLQLYVLSCFLDAMIGFSRGGSFVLPTSWLMALAAAYIFGDVMSIASRHCIGSTQDQLRIRLQEQILAKASSLPLDHLEVSAHYDMLHKAQKGIEQRLPSTLSFLFRMPTQMIVFITLSQTVWSRDYRAFIVLIAGTLWAVRVRTKYLYEEQVCERAQTDRERAQKYIEELMFSRQPAAEIRLFNLGPFLIERWLNLYRGLQSERMRVKAKEAKCNALSGTLQSLTFMALIVLASRSVAYGSLTIGQFIAFIGLISQFHQTIFALLWDSTLIANDIGYIICVFQFLDLKTSRNHQVQRSARTGIIGLANHVPEICFENVSFMYPGMNCYALENINLTIQPGEHLLLVGHNGAGKSTFAKLLLGLYEPTEGRILVDGIDLREIPSEIWRICCSTIFQDFLRYCAPLQDNIGYADISRMHDIDAIVTAAKRSTLHDLALTLPNGYQTQLGRGIYDDAIDLSGGQWQVVALSRAYMRDGHVLVFDEPTASLDARSEIELYSQFKEAAFSRSAVMISHRLGAALMSDRIVLLDAGKITEFGTHVDLLRQRGHYARMWEIQSAWFIDEELRSNHG